jgi:hypothetical protein
MKQKAIVRNLTALQDIVAACPDLKETATRSQIDLRQIQDKDRYGNTIESQLRAAFSAEQTGKWRVAVDGYLAVLHSLRIDDSEDSRRATMILDLETRLKYLFSIEWAPPRGKQKRKSGVTNEKFG